MSAHKTQAKYVIRSRTFGGVCGATLHFSPELSFTVRREGITLSSRSFWRVSARAFPFFVPKFYLALLQTKMQKKNEKRGSSSSRRSAWTPPTCFIRQEEAAFLFFHSGSLIGICVFPFSRSFSCRGFSITERGMWKTQLETQVRPPGALRKICRVSQSQRLGLVRGQRAPRRPTHRSYCRRDFLLSKNVASSRNDGGFRTNRPFPTPRPLFISGVHPIDS